MHRLSDLNTKSISEDLAHKHNTSRAFGCDILLPQNSHQFVTLRHYAAQYEDKTMRVINSINQADTRVFLACVNTRHQTLLSRLAYGVSKTADGYLQLGLPLLLFLIGEPQGQNLLTSSLGCFAIWLPLYWVLKNSCRRPRPPVAIPNFNASIIASDEFSFPSGHTAASFLLATLLVLSYGTIASPAFIWAAAVGCSRVILGVHFPSDILVGASLGIIIAHLGHSALPC